MKHFNFYIALIATVASLSTSAFAIPPIPNSIEAKKETAITCKDINALSVDEIEELNQDPERIVSFDQELREICFK